jgi:hypothetical protein
MGSTHVLGVRSEDAMTLEEAEKLSKKALKRKVNESLALAETRGVEERPGHVADAEFYMRILEDRRDTRVSRRDLILEIIVIGLIGWEIYMSYRAERLQSQNFDTEEKVFTNLEANSAMTAKTLVTVEGTMETMNASLRKQVALFYDLDVIITFDQDTKNLILQNLGRTNVSFWGSRVGDSPITIETEGRTIPAGGGYKMQITKTYAEMMEHFPKPTDGEISFDFFFKNERSEEFDVSGYFAMHWENDVGHFNVQIVSIVPEHWSKKPQTALKPAQKR